MSFKHSLRERLYAGTCTFLICLLGFYVLKLQLLGQTYLGNADKIGKFYAAVIPAGKEQHIRALLAPRGVSYNRVERFFLNIDIEDAFNELALSAFEAAVLEKQRKLTNSATESMIK